MILWLIVCVCITICISGASIFERIKDLVISRVTPRLGLDKFIGELLYCSQCLGFWIGFTGYLLYPAGIFKVDNLFIEAVFAGFVVSTFSIGVYNLIYGRYSISREDRENIIPKV